MRSIGYKRLKILQKLHLPLNEVSKSEHSRFEFAILVVDYEEYAYRGSEEKDRDEDGLPERRDSVAVSIGNAVGSKGLVVVAAGDTATTGALLADLHIILSGLQ